MITNAQMVGQGYGKHEKASKGKCKQRFRKLQVTENASTHLHICRHRKMQVTDNLIQNRETFIH